MTIGGGGVQSAHESRAWHTACVVIPSALAILAGGCPSFSRRRMMGVRPRGPFLIPPLPLGLPTGRPVFRRCLLAV